MGKEPLKVGLPAGILSPARVRGRRSSPKSSHFVKTTHFGSVPITGTSRPPGQTDRPGISPPNPEGAVGLPRSTTKATLAATRALMIEFFVLEQKIL